MLPCRTLIISICTTKSINPIRYLDAQYVLGKQGSKNYGWMGTQAVVLFLQYSMTLNNAYKVYTVLHERKHQQDEKQN